MSDPPRAPASLRVVVLARDPATRRALWDQLQHTPDLWILAELPAADALDVAGKTVYVERLWPEAWALAQVAAFADDVHVIAVAPPSVSQASGARRTPATGPSEGSRTPLRLDTLYIPPEWQPETAADREFTLRLLTAIDLHLSAVDFGVSDLARYLGFSPRQLLRTIQRVTGQSASECLRTHRLRTAESLLRSGEYATVAGVAQAVGLSAPYLARAYRRWAGVSPSEVLRLRVPR